MDQHDIAYVAVAPPEALGEDLLKRVASLIGKELFETRLLLAGEVPGIIASCLDTDTADSMAQSLRNEGLAAFVCRESELRSRSAGFAAHTAHVGQKEVIFQDRRGGEVRIEEGDAFLIMRGKTRSATRQMTSTIKMKLNVPATVLAGGIPIIRPVTKKTIQGAQPLVRIARVVGGEVAEDAQPRSWQASTSRASASSPPSTGSTSSKLDASYRWLERAGKNGVR